MDCHAAVSKQSRAHAAMARSLVCSVCFMALAAMGLSVQAQAQTTPESVFTRGELLYSTHCIECHSRQMHWRAERKARDWETLKVQVRRWQGAVSLRWSESDIEDVARYLNDTIYHFPRQVSQVGSAGKMGQAGQ